MNDRVHIQYTIGLKELPEEVERLIQKVEQLMRGSQTKAMEALCKSKGNNLLSLQTVRSLHEAREAMVSQLQVLKDVENIVNGYIQYEMQNNMEEQQQAAHARAPDTPSAAPQGEAMENLASQLQAFRNQVEEHEESAAPLP
tara:strand:- start:736 stop:1161 length:426 start_codon:yes stop_codon:yes gene_type:complete